MTAVTEGDDGATDAGLTFAAFAAVIGKSRPYVSKLVAEGRIRPPALTAERKIIAHLAEQQIAETADPMRGASVRVVDSASVAGSKARRAAADAERAEIEVRRARTEEQVRRGELLERAAVAAAIGPLLRDLRDQVLSTPREHVLDPAQAAACEEAMRGQFQRLSDRILNHGDGAGG